MPLNLFSIFCSIFMFLSPAISAGLDAKHGCPDRCGNLSIPYPFGVGPSCSLNPYFNIRCDYSSDPPKAYLSFINKLVFEFNETYIRIELLNIFSVCYEDGNRSESYIDSISLDLSGTPYTLSYKNMLTAIGCDDAVLQINGSSTVGGCSAFCVDMNETGGLGYCPFNGTSFGNGCCHSKISRGNVETQLIDLSRKVGRRKLFPCSYAFIQEMGIPNATEFRYPLYYLDNSTTLLNDSWESATRRPLVRLDWVVGAENCSLAKLNDTYACRGDRSVCVDIDDAYYYSFLSGGYRCSCVQGYEGNPYLRGGCKTIEFRSSSITKPGCPDQCGKLSIPFPFGIGRNCYLEPSFEIICNTSTNPPRAYLSILNNVEIIQINSSQVLVNYPNMSLACYNSSVHRHRTTKIVDQSLVMDLSETQFTLSDGNWITAIGLDDMVVGNIRHVNGSSISSICAAVLQNDGIAFDRDYYSFGDCPYGTSSYWPGNGCCRVLIPGGTNYLEVNLTDFSGQWPRTNITCSYAFFENVDLYYKRFSYPFPNNLTQIQSYDWQLESQTILSMDWRIGAVNCNEPRQSLACQSNSKCVDIDATVGGYLCNCSEGYQGNPYLTPGCQAMDWRIESVNCKEPRRNLTCQSNSKCVDFNASVGGYLCNCLEGYQGNPYLFPGCQDIDECVDNNTNACNSNSRCINTMGSYNCLCPKGHNGDGRLDGSGCARSPRPNIGQILLIVVSSAMGLLLFYFWLHKIFKKRKNRKCKEDLFKHLLMQQQTSEDTFGKTKLFTTKELAKATDNFNESRICGQGGQGIVYKGMLSDGTIVAIKKLKQVDQNQVEQFINEVVILSQINHKNVVRLLGCCLATEDPLLVYEFLPNGTLLDFIHDPKIEFPLTWNMRLKIATDAAGALSYLHCASSIPIYHRDIKSTNILLDEKYIVKVSDFGISKLVEVDQTHLTTLVKGTFGYLDPEYYQTSQYTDKSDVYSFGVILVELLTGKRPISMERSVMERNLATYFLASMEANNLGVVLDAQVSDEGAIEEVMAVARLARRCLNVKGRMRPTMKEVATELESLKISQMPSIVYDEPEEEASEEASDAHPLMFEGI